MVPKFTGMIQKTYAVTCPQPQLWVQDAGFKFSAALACSCVFTLRIYCITHSIQRCSLMCTDEKQSCPQITGLFL